MPAIEVERLNVWMQAGARQVHAVRDVSLSVEAGGQLTIVGESGSGKSTLLLALLGLLPPTATVSGRIAVDGIDVLRGSDSDILALRWKRAAMVFQASSNPLNPVRTVGSQLIHLLRWHGADRATATARAANLLEQVRLPARCAGLYPHQLSGGMKQRVVIAFAIACGPGILLADEPTTALDPIVQADILALLQSLRATLGHTLVLVTHDLQLVGRSHGDLAVMLGGAIVEHGPTRRLMAAPSHHHLQTLIAALPDFGRRTASRGEAQHG